jgi:hypothetical protein
MSDNPIFSERTRQALKGKRPYIPTDAECLRNPKVRALLEAAGKARQIANGAFVAGMEERENGSARRQGKLIDQYNAKIAAIDAALAAMQEPPQ